MVRLRCVLSLALVVFCLTIASESASTKRSRAGAASFSSGKGQKRPASSGREWERESAPPASGGSRSRGSGSGSKASTGGGRGYGAPRTGPPQRRPAAGAAGGRRATPSRRQDEESEYDDSRGYGRGAVVPARRRPQAAPRPSVLSGIMNTLADKAASMQEDTKGKVLEWRKIAKGKFSSTFERFMLQLTWPDDTPIDQTFLQDLMHYLDHQDDYPNEHDKTNPYRRTLRKLWARMCENDWRTVAKSLMLVHSMSRSEDELGPAELAVGYVYFSLFLYSFVFCCPIVCGAFLVVRPPPPPKPCRDLSPPAASRVRKHIMTMRRELNPKNPAERYFQLGRVVSVSPTGHPFSALLKDYAAFAFKRVVAFDGGMRKLSSVLKSPKTPEATAVALLTQVDGLICLGVRCKLERKSQLNEVTKSMIQLTSTDLLELWRLLSGGIERLCQGRYSMAERALSDDVAALMHKAKDTQAALDKYLELFRKFVKDRSAFDDNQLDADAIATSLARLDTGGGDGGGARGVGAAASGIEDEDEEDEEDAAEEEEGEECEEEGEPPAAAPSRPPPPTAKRAAAPQLA
ncbi:unnamed protein product, partial [Phaeothamnion confervicola]